MTPGPNEPVNNNEITLIRRQVEKYLHAVGLPQIEVEKLTKQTLEKISSLPSAPDRLGQAMDEVLTLLEQRNLSAETQVKTIITGETTPPIKRASMAFKNKVSPRPYSRIWFKSLVLRRLLLYSLTVLSVILSGYMMLEVFVPDGLAKFEISIIIVYLILMSWIALNFWTMLLGFSTLIFGGDGWRLYIPPDEHIKFNIPSNTRVAVIMPVYNEDVARIYAGIQTIYESLKKTSQLNQFDFFILSDSTEISKEIEEKAGWAELCRRVNGFGKIFYRHRKNRIHKKSGNVSDFVIVDGFVRAGGH